MGDGYDNGTRGWPALLPPLAIMVVTFIVSSIPGGDEQAASLLGFVPPAIQNLLHIPLFGLLAWAWCKALAVPARTTARVIVPAALITIGWSVFDELHQLYVPGRFASLTDMTLNLTGIAIGLGWFARTRP